MRRPLALLVLLLAVLHAAGVAAPAAAQTANPTPPGATTGPAEAITRTTATLTGTVDPNRAETTYRFEYGTSTAYGLQTANRPAGAGDAEQRADAPVEGLTPSTTYHFRIVATNAAGVTRGADRTFRTAANPRPPGTEPLPARALSPTGATLAARVDPNGSATRVRFEYGTSTSYGLTTDEIAAGPGDAPVELTARVEGLRPRTTYHFRVVATNAAGVTRSRDRTLRTFAAPTGIDVALGPGAKAPAGTVRTVTGSVRGTGVGSLPIALEAQLFPFGGPYAQVARGTTSRSGGFRLTTGPLLVNARLRVVTRSRVVIASPVLTALAAVRVGASPVPGASGRAVVIKGTVTPAAPEGRVSVQRQTRSGRWVPVRRAGVRPLDAGRSGYRLTVRRLRRTATFRVVVLPREGGANVRGDSRAFGVRGSRPLATPSTLPGVGR